MSFRRHAWTVYTKELRSLSRDRHTLIYSLLLPLFLYPMVVLLMLQGVTYTRGIEERQVSRVGVVQRSDSEVTREFLDFLSEQPRLRVVDPAGVDSGDDDLRARAAAWLRTEEVDVVLTPADGPPPGEVVHDSALEPFHVGLFYDGARGPSTTARGRVDAVMVDFRAGRLKRAAEALGEPESFVEVLTVHQTNLATAQELTNTIAGMLLPLLMILMIALGALYPALECTVGEKEKKTLETSLLSPATGSSLVAGKYLAVMTFSMAAFLLNFGSMLLVLSHLKLQLDIVDLELSLASALLILLGASLMVVFLSGVTMLLAFLARSFKEGQTYVTPVFLLALGAALTTSTPGSVLTPAWACVPLVNIVLLFRESLIGRFPVPSIAIVVLTSVLYTGLALWAAGRLLRRETVATGRFSWREVFARRGEAS